MAAAQVRGLPRTRRVWFAITRAAARRVTGWPAAARRESTEAVRRAIVGTARTAGRVIRRWRRMRVRIAEPRTMCGSTARRAVRSAGEIAEAVAAPAIASASASVRAWEATAA